VAAAAREPVLIVSTDPAHSLGDALGVRLSGRATRIRRSRAWAIELDSSTAFARWLRAHRRALAEILAHGTWLDRDDIDALLELPIPGIDELAGTLEIVRLAAGPGRDVPSSRAGSRRERGDATLVRRRRLIVVDTAPTGHMLRLMNAPATVAAVAEVLDALQEPHRAIREQFARVTRPEVADRVIELLARQAAATVELLRDRDRVEFRWVTLPEELSLAETLDGLRELEQQAVPVEEIVVNRVIGTGPSCPICDRRRTEERQTIARIRRTFSGRYAVRLVPAELIEPRGVHALTRLGRGLRSGASDAMCRPVLSGAGRLRPRVAHLSISNRGRRALPERLDALRGARLVFFGGKGGVGKTTVAAATAIRVARANPGRRVLLLSTDPAHSLSDAFEAGIGDRPARVERAPANLRVRELDAPAAFRARRAALETAMDEMATAFGASGPESGVRRLMDLAPPGIDELFGMLSVADHVAERRRSPSTFDVVIVDTAPTGHALRLLEMPEVAREWVRVLMRLVLKYRAVVRPARLASELVDMSASIRRLQTLLRSGALTRFIEVTRAAALASAETDRLSERLSRLGLAAPAIVVNAMTFAPGRCPRCRTTAAAERRELTRLRATHPSCAIIQAPLTAPPPRGSGALERWGGAWISG
jgi:arsenite-transporting ATPase